jgi:hypothetical protein
MKRSTFIKSLLAGAVVAALPVKLLADKAATPKLYAFKINHDVYKRIQMNSIGFEGIDKLCIELTGYPVKQIGYERDDFACNRFTVVSFRKEMEESKQLHL